jgi:hypothetical protein
MKTFTKGIQSLVLVVLSILVSFQWAPAQTGTLTGVVKNCYTNAPIAGATVTCGASIVTTNATGAYTIVNLAAGNCTATASATGYLTQSAPCTINSGQTTVLNFCLSPPAATLTGTITNCVTGVPIEGAKVAIGTNFTYSNAAGNYTLQVFPGGTFTVTVSMTGYSTLTSSPVTLTPPQTTVLNILLKPALPMPSPVTAALNSGQTAVDISWSPPNQSNEIAYDDGSGEQCIQYLTTGSSSAVRFTPCGYPAIIKACKVHVCGTVSTLTPFDVILYKDDGPGGTPGTVLAGPVTLTPTAIGWLTGNLSSPITLNSGSFFIAVIQTGSYPNCSGISQDTTVNQLQSFEKTGAGPWVPAGGNFMIRAMVDEPCGLVPAGNLTYTVYRLLQGQENTPAAWTTIGTLPGTATTFTDNGWPSLPCNPYRWAVKATYPCSGSTAAGFSNAIGICWTSYVIVHGHKCCDSLPKAGMPIHLVNTAYPDTVYNANTDTSGTAIIPNVWKGSYTLTSSIFGCGTYTQVVTIINDTVTFNIHMTTGITASITGLAVNDSTLFSHWHRPQILQGMFAETWSSGNLSFNGWTTSGGTNWTVTSGSGNPSPSAQFYWSPQATNYSQVLTSKVITGVGSTSLRLQYDILLDNYSTNSTNSLNVEFWNGTTWSILKVHDNQSGSFPWTHEVIDISNYSGQDFRIAFHAYGDDSYDINFWEIDNITVTAFSDVPCLLGYNVSLNSTLSGFTPDTSWQIPPNQVIYGHPYQVCVTAVYGYGYSPAVCEPFTSHYLYPPRNFNGDSLECNAILSWLKPEDFNGFTPAGLVGYNVFRNGAFVHYLPSPDSLQFVDYDVDPGDYLYSCTAKYDLSSYGFTGQFGESLRQDASDSVYIACGDQMPFGEGWDHGTFSYNNWTFEPSQGNWGVTTASGNPPPVADFSWMALDNSQVVNYSYALVSPPIDASQWLCSDIFLKFDIKLIDQNMTGTEKMAVEVLYDNAWHLLTEFSNTGSFGWQTETINMNAVRGKGLKVRFRAHGQNSTNILHWYIDNISVYGVCPAPSGLQATATTEHVVLNWTAPCPQVSGYNVFRSDSSGNAPFVKLNATPVTATTFTDTPPGWSPAVSYKYYVTALQWNTVLNQSLCESAASDTILAAFPVGIGAKNAGPVKIYPNPASEYVIVRSEIPVNRILVTDQLGVPVKEILSGGEKQVRISIHGMSSGIYLVRVVTGEGISICKLVVSP